MFFQDASAAGSGATPPKDNFDFDNVRKGLDGISREIIGTFTQGRERVFEFERAVADSLPAVRSLGGDIKDVGKIIQEVGLAARRNVVANEDEIKSLFSASEVLGLTTQQIADSFLDVGVGIESISDALEGSIDYVRGIGGNARQVMKDVQANMEQMNRYQFEGGVVGLTKMAAQASMLRFDMQQTFQLAEKVLSPEGAVETAAAFQRLGLAVGNLADPFALMNASINDPGSLQDSLVEVSKQFTYFDEKTKTFKINPQGVLTLRELESQTGVSAKEMSKLGLAAAELDQRLTQISPTLKFQNEEDKQYLANIGRMGEGGQYEVKIKGQEDYVKLGQLTQEQLDELITEQKTGPKTVEELQRAQLTVDELIQSEGGTTTEDDYWTNLTVEGSSGANRNLGTVADQVREQKSLIELLGEIKVNVNFQDLPAGLTTEQKEQITKTFSDKINAQNFKDYIVNVTRPDNAFRGGGTATY
jgi:hypothetical protein